MTEKQRLEKAKQFSKLHEQSSTFVLPNAWDAMSAKIFEQHGFKAVGTTSAGIAASLGYTDGQNIPIKKMLEAIKNITRTVNIPVSADIEAGYGTNTNEVINTVRAVADAGAVGINIEDGTGYRDHPLFDLSFQKEKIQAIHEFTISTGTDLFVNARIDTYWLNVGHPVQRFQDTIERAIAYRSAGADCIFVPGLHDIAVIQNLREQIDCPINLLVSPKMPNITELSMIGIERLSTGSAPFRSTVTLMNKIAEEIKNREAFTQMTDDIITYEEVTKLI